MFIYSKSLKNPYKQNKRDAQSAKGTERGSIQLNWGVKAWDGDGKLSEQAPGRSNTCAESGRMGMNRGRRERTEERWISDGRHSRKEE